MKVKALVLSLLICLTSVSLIFVSNYKRHEKSYKEIETSYKTELAMILIEGYGDTAVETELNAFPDSNTHYLDFAKSICANGSTISWDTTNNKVKITSTKADKCKLYFRAGTAVNPKSDILASNTLVKATPNFSVAATDTNTNIYESTDDLGTSYYFRGAATNNYVQFGYYKKETQLTVIDYNNWTTKNITIPAHTPMYWRIIRINGDDTIRLIYDGTNIGVDTSIVDQTPFNNDYGLYKDSQLKNSLDAWYNNNIKNNFDKYISDGIFCNDRKLSDYSGEYEYYYEPYIRLVQNKNPQLTCTQSIDRYTVGNIGNGQLSNPVGTITADEIMMAGGVANSNNQSYYLYSGDNYWTLTPTFYEGGNYPFDHAFYAHNSSTLSHYVVGSDGMSSDYVGVRPIINLNANLLFTGSGTNNDPYKVAGFE